MKTHKKIIWSKEKNKKSLFFKVFLKHKNKKLSSLIIKTATRIYYFDFQHSQNALQREGKNKKEEFILVILEIPIYRSLWIKSSIELAQPYTVGPSPQPFWTYFTGEIPKICLKICRPRNSPQSLCWWAHARVQLFPPVNLGLHSFEQIEAKIIHLRAFQNK